MLQFALKTTTDSNNKVDLKLMCLARKMPI